LHSIYLCAILKIMNKILNLFRRIFIINSPLPPMFRVTVQVVLYLCYVIFTYINKLKLIEQKLVYLNQLNTSSSSSELEGVSDA